jgi:hypothetical protein
MDNILRGVPPLQLMVQVDPVGQTEEDPADPEEKVDKTL